MTRGDQRERAREKNAKLNAGKKEGTWIFVASKKEEDRAVTRSKP
jgi:hypothetical protein